MRRLIAVVAAHDDLQGGVALPHYGPKCGARSSRRLCVGTTTDTSGPTEVSVEPIEVIAERAGRHANRHLDLADVVGPDADQRTTQSLVGLGLPHSRGRVMMY